MGNYASCAMAGATRGKDLKVVLPSGEVRTFNESVNATELMLEMPNYFAVNAQSLAIGGPFLALNDEDDLFIGNMYILFPIERLKSVVGPADMDGLSNKKSKSKSKSKSKVVPLMQFIEEEEARKRMEEDEVKKEPCLPEMGRRWSMVRSKKPVLETIIEEPTWVM